MPRQRRYLDCCGKILLDAEILILPRNAFYEMDELFIPRIGAVFSADIAVPKLEKEVRFYSQVLCTGEHPLWRENDLTNNLGMPIIGLGERSPDYAHLPIQWMPHIQVADVAASVQRAHSLDGSVLLHARDSNGESQWAVLGDPNGAAFGIVPIVPPEALPSGDSPLTSTSNVGQISWLDLTVSNAPLIRDFYSHVIGWSVNNVEMVDGNERYSDYAMLSEDGVPVAGICHARGMNIELPPVWMIYLQVGDLAESLRHVEKSEGSRVILHTMEGEHTYAAIQDPVGAYLALMPAIR